MINLFYQGSKSNEWTQIRAEKMESFFKTVSFLIATFLRGIIRDSIQDFAELFQSSFSLKKYGDLSKSPMYYVRLVCIDQKICFEPSFNDLDMCIEMLLDRLITAVDNIPKLETQLFSTNSKKGNTSPDNFISVGFNDYYSDEVTETKRNIKRNLQHFFHEAEEYVPTFNAEKSLLTNEAEDDVDRLLNMTSELEPLIEVSFIFYS